MSRMTLMWACLLVALFVGCDDMPSGSDAGTSSGRDAAGPHPFDLAQANQNVLASLICPCLGGTADDIEACMMRVQSTAELTCRRAVFDANRAAIEPTMTCLNAATTAYVACIGALPSACGDGYTDCTNMANVAFADCPRVPADLAETWGQCDS